MVLLGFLFLSLSGAVLNCVVSGIGEVYWREFECFAILVSLGMVDDGDVGVVGYVAILIQVWENFGRGVS